MARYLTLNTKRVANVKGPNIGKTPLFFTNGGKPACYTFKMEWQDADTGEVRKDGLSIRVPEKIAAALERRGLVSFGSTRTVTQEVNIIEEAGGGGYPDFLKILPGTEAAVSGPHPATIHFDEVELMDPEVFEEGLTSR